MGKTYAASMKKVKKSTRKLHSANTQRQRAEEEEQQQEEEEERRKRRRL
jgi:hypothetical protein